MASPTRKSRGRASPSNSILSPITRSYSCRHSMICGTAPSGYVPSTSRNTTSSCTWSKAQRRASPLPRPWSYITSTPCSLAISTVWSVEWPSTTTILGCPHSSCIRLMVAPIQDSSFLVGRIIVTNVSLHKRCFCLLLRIRKQ